MDTREARRKGSGWTVRRRLIVWLVGSVVGVAIVALPDSDDRLFSLSRTHGPSPVDVLGMLVLLAAWIPIPAALWRRRQAIHGGAAVAITVLAVAGVVGLTVAVGFDLGPLYLVPVLVLVVAQLLALRVVAGSGSDGVGSGDVRDGVGDEPDVPLG